MLAKFIYSYFNVQTSELFAVIVRHLAKEVSAEIFDTGVPSAQIANFRAYCAMYHVNK